MINNEREDILDDGFSLENCKNVIKNSKERCFALKKFVYLFFCFSYLWFFRIMISKIELANNICIQDHIFNLSSTFNSYLFQNKSMRDYFLISAGFSLDTLVIFLSIFFFCLF